MAGLHTVDDVSTDSPQEQSEAEQVQEPGSNLNAHQLQLALASAERKLAEARLQIAELEALLEELPDIFERKFEQRLQPVLERQERLLNDNTDLRQQIQMLAPVPGEVGLRFNPGAAPASGTPALPQLPSGPAMQRVGRGKRRGPHAA
jgi:hypothetical protein